MNLATATTAIIAIALAGTATAIPERMVLNFADGSVEICTYAQLSFMSDGEVLLDGLSSCVPDQMFKDGFE